MSLNLRYAALVAKEDRHIREVLGLLDIAKRHNIPTGTVEASLSSMLASWEQRFPRLSALLMERTQ